MFKSLFCLILVTIMLFCGVIDCVPIVFLVLSQLPPTSDNRHNRFNSTLISLPLLPLCLWLEQCLYPRARWLAAVVFCGVIQSFLQTHVKPHFHTLTSVVHIVPWSLMAPRSGQCLPAIVFVEPKCRACPGAWGSAVSQLPNASPNYPLPDHTYLSLGILIQFDIMQHWTSLSLITIKTIAINISLKHMADSVCLYPTSVDLIKVVSSVMSFFNTLSVFIVPLTTCSSFQNVVFWQFVIIIFGSFFGENCRIEKD